MSKSLRNFLIVFAIIVVLGVALGVTSTVTVPAGHTGVVTTLGKVEDYVLDEGLHFKLPWQQVVKMDNRTQKQTITTATFSSDIQQVDVIVSLNFSVDRATSQSLYRNVGPNYYSTVIEPEFFGSVKDIFALYSAEDLIAARNELATKIIELLAPKMKVYGIQVSTIAVEDMDFTDDFTNAVEAKQVAEQNKLKAATEQEQANMEAEAAAKRKVVAAEAEAEVKKIEADAKKYATEQEAAANDKLAQSITQTLIDYFSIEKWDGKLPSIYSGEGEMLPILNITPEDVSGDSSSTKPEVTPNQGGAQE